MPALLITDALIRALPGFIAPEVYQNETLRMKGKFDFSTYTRPEGKRFRSLILTPLSFSWVS